MAVISFYKAYVFQCGAIKMWIYMTNILVFITFISNHLFRSTWPNRISQREKMHRLESFSCHGSYGYYDQFIKSHHKIVLQTHKPENVFPLINFYSWCKLCPPTWQTYLPLQFNLSSELYFPGNASHYIPFLCTYLKDFLISSALIVLRISWYKWGSIDLDGVASGGQFVCA